VELVGTAALIAASDPATAAPRAATIIASGSIPDPPMPQKK
jgi:hypothetical protein